MHYIFAPVIQTPAPNTKDGRLQKKAVPVCRGSIWRLTLQIYGFFEKNRRFATVLQRKTTTYQSTNGSSEPPRKREPPSVDWFF
jgi:hypothetical protein